MREMPPLPPDSPLSRHDLRRSGALAIHRHHNRNRRGNQQHQHHRLIRSSNASQARSFDNSVARRLATPRHASTSRHSQTRTRNSRLPAQALVSRDVNSPALATRDSRVPSPRKRFLWNAFRNTLSNTSTSTFLTFPRSVVLDALSIGQSGSVFNDGSVSFKAILNALSFYTKNAIRVVAILPENTRISDFEKTQFEQRFATLSERGLLVIAPCSGHGFDCFIIRTAITFGADLVSNNLFKSALIQQHRDRTKINQFLRTQVIPFAFCFHQFVPHPDASAIASGLHGPRVQSPLLSNSAYARYPQAAIANKRR